MGKLKLNSEILSKMKLDLSRIFKDDEHADKEILIQKERTDRVISNILKLLLLNILSFSTEGIYCFYH